MIVSIARATSPRRPAWLHAALWVAVAAFLSTPGPLDAQQDVGEPLRLGPPATNEREADRPVETQPESEPASPDSEPEAGFGQPPDEDIEGIEVDRLADIEPDGIGILDPGRGGLGPAIWEGTSRHVVLEMLPRIPTDLDSPALQDLANRLLASATRPPDRRQTSSDSGSLLLLRMEILAAMGEADGVREMLRVIPRDRGPAGLRRLQTESSFLAGDSEEACRIVRNALAESDEPFWQMALAVCQLGDGAADEANLTLSLLRETGAEVDPGFHALFDAVERGAAQAPAFADAGPLHVALLALGEVAAPSNVVAQASPRVLLALARQESGGAESRTEAAERAAALGLLDAEELGAYYARFDFDAELLSEAASMDGADGLSPVRKRALLFQAAREEPAPAVLAELASEALEGAGTALYLPTARLFAPMLADIEVRPDLAWFAETAGRALYAAGRGDAAGRWLTMVRQESILNPEAARTVTALWPYARLSRETEVPLNEGLAAWRSVQSGDNLETLSYRESLLRATFEALDRAEPRSWIDIAAQESQNESPVASAALVYALKHAGQERRRGEAVMLTLIAVGEQGVENCHPLVLGKALSALKEVGLEEEAHALALEAAVRNGI